MNESCAASCTDPGCKWCINNQTFFDGTPHMRHRCNTCQCRSCWVCQGYSTRRLITSAKRHGVTSRALVVLFRGIAFRVGGHGANERVSQNDTKRIEAQLNALRSSQKHVIEPAAQRGWIPVEVLVDVDVPPVLRSGFEGAIHHLVGPRLTAMRLNTRLHTQAETILANIEFALHSSRTPVAAWHSLLLIRVDLTLKKEVVLPPPSSLLSGEMVVPFRVNQFSRTSDNLTGNGNGSWASAPMLINDLLVLLPLTRISEAWTRALIKTHVPGQMKEHEPLESVCAEVEKEYCNVRFLEACAYDANTQTERIRCTRSSAVLNQVRCQVVCRSRIGSTTCGSSPQRQRSMLAA